MVRSCSLRLTGRATDALLDHLDLETTEEVAAAVLDNLSEESALEPFDGTFADGASTDGHYYLAGTELRLHVRVDDQSRQHLVALNAWPASSSELERVGTAAGVRPGRGRLTSLWTLTRASSG